MEEEELRLNNSDISSIGNVSQSFILKKLHSDSRLTSHKKNALFLIELPIYDLKELGANTLFFYLIIFFMILCFTTLFLLGDFDIEYISLPKTNRVWISSIKTNIQNSEEYFTNFSERAELFTQNFLFLYTRREVLKNQKLYTCPSSFCYRNYTCSSDNKSLSEVDGEHINNYNWCPRSSPNNTIITDFPYFKDLNVWLLSSEAENGYSFTEGAYSYAIMSLTDMYNLDLRKVSSKGTCFSIISFKEESSDKHFHSGSITNVFTPMADSSFFYKKSSGGIFPLEERNTQTFRGILFFFHTYIQSRKRDWMKFLFFIIAVLYLFVTSIKIVVNNIL